MMAPLTIHTAICECGNGMGDGESHCRQCRERVASRENRAQREWVDPKKAKVLRMNRK
jgi:hypothetical protein